MTDGRGPDPRPVRLIACGIFRQEFGLLEPGLRERFSPTFMDSMLHMEPGRLDSILRSALPDGRPPAVLAYGDCCPHMDLLASPPRAARTDGVNCCEIWLGSARYRSLRDEAVFFLMPEWALRWARIIKRELGLDSPELARDFMSQSMRSAVYIDTGVMPVPESHLEAFSAYTGLACRVETVGPGNFREAVVRALAGAGSDPGRAEG